MLVLVLVLRVDTSGVGLQLRKGVADGDGVPAWGWVAREVVVVGEERRWEMFRRRKAEKELIEGE